jgi:hypothetical protein
MDSSKVIDGEWEMASVLTVAPVSLHVEEKAEL